MVPLRERGRPARLCPALPRASERDPDHDPVDRAKRDQLLPVPRKRQARPCYDALSANRRGSQPGKCGLPVRQVSRGHAEYVRVRSLSGLLRGALAGTDVVIRRSGRYARRWAPGVIPGSRLSEDTGVAHLLGRKGGPDRVACERVTTPHSIGRHRARAATICSGSCLELFSRPLTFSLLAHCQCD